METVPVNRSWEVLHFPEPPAAHTNETRGPTDGVKKRDNIQSEKVSEAVTPSMKLLLTLEPTWCRENSGVQDSWKRRL